jgi:hypothetical protein
LIAEIPLENHIRERYDGGRWSYIDVDMLRRLLPLLAEEALALPAGGDAPYVQGRSLSKRDVLRYLLARVLLIKDAAGSVDPEDDLSFQELVRNVFLGMGKPAALAALFKEIAAGDIEAVEAANAMDPAGGTEGLSLRGAVLHQIKRNREKSRTPRRLPSSIDALIEDLTSAAEGSFKGNAALVRAAVALRGDIIAGQDLLFARRAPSLREGNYRLSHAGGVVDFSALVSTLTAFNFEYTGKPWDVWRQDLGQATAGQVFDTFMMEVLKSLSLRIWDEGDAEAPRRLDEIQRLLDAFNAQEEGFVPYVDQAESLLQLGVSGVSDIRSIADIIFKAEKTLTPAQAGRFGAVLAMANALHLRRQLRAERAKPHDLPYIVSQLWGPQSIDYLQILLGLRMARAAETLRSGSVGFERALMAARSTDPNVFLGPSAESVDVLTHSSWTSPEVNIRLRGLLEEYRDHIASDSPGLISRWIGAAADAHEDAALSVDLAFAQRLARDLPLLRAAKPELSHFSYEDLLWGRGPDVMAAWEAAASQDWSKMPNIRIAPDAAAGRLATALGVDRLLLTTEPAYRRGLPALAAAHGQDVRERGRRGEQERSLDGFIEDEIFSAARRVVGDERAKALREKIRSLDGETKKRAWISIVFAPRWEWSLFLNPFRSVAQIVESHRPSNPADPFSEDAVRESAGRVMAAVDRGARWGLFLGFLMDAALWAAALAFAPIDVFFSGRGVVMGLFVVMALPLVPAYALAFRVQEQTHRLINIDAWLKGRPQDALTVDEPPDFDGILKSGGLVDLLKMGRLHPDTMGLRRITSLLWAKSGDIIMGYDQPTPLGSGGSFPIVAKFNPFRANAPEDERGGILIGEWGNLMQLAESPAGDETAVLSMPWAEWDKDPKKKRAVALVFDWNELMSEKGRRKDDPYYRLPDLREKLQSAEGVVDLPGASGALSVKESDRSFALGWSRDGKAVTVVAGDGEVTDWNIQARTARTRRIAWVEQHERIKERPEMALSRGGDFIAVSYDHGIAPASGNVLRTKPFIEIREAATGKLLAQRESTAGGLVWDADDRLIFLESGKTGDAVVLWPWAKNEDVRVIAPVRPGSRAAPKVSPDGRWLAVGNAGGSLLDVFDLASLKKTEVSLLVAFRAGNGFSLAEGDPAAAGPVLDLTWAPDSSTLATGQDGRLGLWKLEAGSVRSLISRIRGKKDASPSRPESGPPETGADKTKDDLVRDILSAMPAAPEQGSINDLKPGALLRRALADPSQKVDQAALARVLWRAWGRPSDGEKAEASLRDALSRPEGGLETLPDVTVPLSPELLNDIPALEGQVDAAFMMNTGAPVRFLMEGSRIPRALSERIAANDRAQGRRSSTPVILEQGGTLFHGKELDPAAVLKHVPPASSAPRLRIYVPSGYQVAPTSGDPRLKAEDVFVPMLSLERFIEHFRELSRLIAAQA